MRKIKRNDIVKVISGDEKGKIGVVLFVYSKPIKFKSDIKKRFIIVSNVNIKKIRDNSKSARLSEKKTYINKECGIDISNVAFYNSDSKCIEKIGFRYGVNGKKERYMKSSLLSI